MSSRSEIVMLNNSLCITLTQFLGFFWDYSEIIRRRFFLFYPAVPE
jgi:hypothetical protein